MRGLESSERHLISPWLVTGKLFFWCLPSAALLNDYPPKYDEGSHLELAWSDFHVPLSAYGEKLLQPGLKLLDILS